MPGFLLLRLHPPDAAGIECRPRRAHLQLSDLAAIRAARPDRQPALAVAGGNEIGERQNAPAPTARAVGVQLVLVVVHAGECSHVGHALA